MASSKEYLAYVLEQLAMPDRVTVRSMMGEYVLYYCGKAVGGIYDDRMLLKPTESALKLLDTPETDVPYEGAKALLVLNPDEAELVRRVIAAIADDLPEPIRKERKK